MQFIAVATALFATALAAPAVAPTADCPNPAHCQGPPEVGSYENINIKNLFVRKTGDKVVAVDFKLSGDDVTDIVCKNGPVELNANLATCGDSQYRFGLLKGKTTEFALAIYHQTGQASGKWAEGDVTTYCRAGGDGADDFICGDVNPVTTIVITS